MRAIKLKALVTEDHILRLELPEDIEEGPAEVIVLVEEPEEAASASSLAEALADSAVDPRYERTKEAIDRDLRTERDAWE